MKKLIWIVFLAAFAVADLSAAEYYVDPVNGADTNDGSASSPWKTLAHAVATAQENDVLTLKKGTHTITATLTIDKALEIRGEGDKEETIITVTGQRYFKITADNTFVHSLTFANSSNAYLEKAVTLSSESVVSNVVIRNFNIKSKALYITKGVATDCYITNNLSRNYILHNGGGVLENSVIANNTLGKSDGGEGLVLLENTGTIVRNCTIVNNTLAANDYGLYIYTKGPKVYNCIIANNKSGDVIRNLGMRELYVDAIMPNIVWNAIFPLEIYKSATSLVSASKYALNFGFDPLFSVDGITILKNSPCNGGGTNGVDAAGVAYSTRYDINGVLRGNPPSIGAYEYVQSKSMTLVPKYSALTAHQPEVIKLWCDVDGTYTEPLLYEWDTDGDGVADFTGSTNVLSEIGVYKRVSVVISDAGGQKLSTSFENVFTVHQGESLTFYVDGENGSDEADGTAGAPWKTLCFAVGDPRVLDGDKICLQKGRHVLDKLLTLDKAVDIYGGDGDKASCVVVITNETGRFNVLKGGAAIRDITLLNEDVTGGGPLVSMSAEGMISNVVITSLFEEKPTAASKTIFNLSAGTISGCFITNNCANTCFQIGWATTGRLIVENCAIVDNSFYADNGLFTIEAGNIKFRNCTIAKNLILKNKKAFYARYGSYSNNIIWDNVDSNGVALPPTGAEEAWYRNLLQGYESISADRIKGECFAADPKFRNGKCLSFYSDSPCIDAGDNSHAPQSSVDILGNPRIFKKTIDLGCVEVQIMPGFYIRVR